MGIRVSVVVATTSFLLGIFCTHWMADSLTLWQSHPAPDANILTAARYYSLLGTMPDLMTYFMFGVGTLAAVALAASFRDGRAGNFMFDGASIFLYLSSLAVYNLQILPNLTILSHPELLPSSATSPLPPSIKNPTQELATNHLLVSVALTGVILLQAGRRLAEQDDAAEDATESEASSDITVTSPSPAPASGRRRQKENGGDEVEGEKEGRVLRERPPSLRRKELRKKGSVGRGSGGNLKR